MEILTSQTNSVRAASETWQGQMKTAIRDLGALAKYLDLSPESLKCGPLSSPDIKALDQFPLFAPLPFVNRIQRGNARDPLLLQFLPRAEEDQSPSHFTTDPLAESEATLTPGLLQKYEGRVLLVTTGACAIHCRYCFRRHFPYSSSPKTIDQWIPAIEAIEQDDSIEEVILSGGDPLTIVDSTLQKLIQRLDRIEHVTRLRIHSRLPIMIPQRVTPELVNSLADFQGQVVFVIHSNHANEFDHSVDEALQKLRRAGATLLNQTVLLRDINDQAETLIALSKRLLKADVMPYYLHQLDPITGTSHFEVQRERGLELISAMRIALPGYAVPRYVQEFAGEKSKTNLEAQPSN